MTVREDVYEVLYEEDDLVEFDDILEKVREERNVSALEVQETLKELTEEYYVKKDGRKYKISL